MDTFLQLKATENLANSEIEKEIIKVMPLDSKSESMMA